MIQPKKGDGPESLSLPLAEKAYIAIKKMILENELKPGDQINVAQLCTLLSIGRSPIHQAIHRLDREGLVAILPRKGILIKAETIDSFLSLIDARLLVEPYLTGEAMQRMTPELLDKLKKNVQIGRQCAQNNDHQGSMEVDRLFHQTLYEAANNELLANFAGQLLDRSMRLWFRTHTPGAENPNIHELEALYETIASADRTAAVEMMAQHIISIRKKVFP